MHFARLYLLIALLYNITGDIPDDRLLFTSPLRIPLALSANFGELRSDHFHSGLDIKTQGITGKEVVASASGFVYRISVSPGGFGKTIYMRHPSGYSTVYAHLDRFIPEIEEYVIQRQYERRNYMVNLFPPKEKFRFDQGDVIAYSGNSGSSTGPHLHYEIRNTDGEKPVNPLLFDFGIDDNIKPVIEKLVIYPMYGKTYINGRSQPLHINVSGSNGDYYLPKGLVINISGAAGFGIKSYDQYTNSINKCAPYSIQLLVDSIPVFTYEMNSFSFNETRFINSHIDYELLVKDKTYIERLFLLPNNKLRAYRDVINNGIVNFTDGRKHRVEMVVTDIHRNTSVLAFNVSSAASTMSESMNQVNNGILMPYSRRNRFATDKISVDVPAGNLYDTLYFEYTKSDGRKGMYSEFHHVHNRYTPVHRSFSLSIKPDSVQPGMERSMLIVQTGYNGSDIALNSSWNNGYLTANPGTFGTFYIGIDTIAPVIIPVGFSDGSDLSGSKQMRIRITDNLSGIKSYEPLIDGKWALFEYDQKNNTLIYRFDQNRIASGKKHDLRLRAEDNTGNVNYLRCSFTW